MVQLLSNYFDALAVISLIGALITIYGFLQRFLKDQILVTEVMAATALGVIAGPKVANVLDPFSNNTEPEKQFAILYLVTNIVLGIQLVSAALALPMSYMQQQWRSILLLVGPLLVLEWAVTWGCAVAIFGHQLGLLKCLLIAATLTPTDPVLASSILQGKFAERHIPVALRNLLSAESASNDGLALPFVALPMLLLDPRLSTGAAVGEWFWNAWAYQVILSVIAGFAYGCVARGLLWVGVKYDLIDEPSFLGHILGLALGTVGSISLIGSDGLLGVFVAAVAFGGSEPTAEENRYDALNGIELLLNIAFFFYFGSTLPFAAWGRLGVGKLVLFSTAVLLLRRLPLLVATARWVPELNRWPGGWRSQVPQACFAGFFGPMGVGALYYTAVVYDRLKDETTFHVVSFVVLASILVHGVTGAPFAMLLNHTLQGLLRKEQLTGVLLTEVVDKAVASNQTSNQNSLQAGMTVGSYGAGTSASTRRKGGAPERPSLASIDSWVAATHDTDAQTANNEGPPTEARPPQGP